MSRYPETERDPPHKRRRPVEEEEEDTKPVELLRRLEREPDGAARVSDLVDLHERIGKRVKRDTADSIWSRMSDLSNKVRVLWWLLTVAGGLALANGVGWVRSYGDAQIETASSEWRLKAVEDQLAKMVGEQLKMISDTVHSTQSRLRDIEETVRLNTLQIDELLRRAGYSPPQRKP